MVIIFSILVECWEGRAPYSDYMAMLEQNAERVIRYFQDRHVRYAA